MINSIYGALGGGIFDEQQYQMDLMKRMANQQNQANGLGLGGFLDPGHSHSIAQQYAQPRPVPNPEPNKVLLLLGDDE